MKDLIIIAGPCSVETLEQLDSVAESLQQTDISYMRGGIWKPRTRPGSYEGVGEIGLAWMQDARRKYGHKLIVEVANTTQVETVLNAEIDAVWIGARTTVNPFYVQEIANALEGTDIPVFVKNPINPDLSLWIGAIERIRSRTKGKVSAIHRGFSSFEKYKYRNQPHWTIPISLKQEFPDMDLLCDPSHISGDRQVVSEVAQQAMELRFDGLMIETHPNPDEALSDAAQQLTPQQLKEMMKQLIIPRTSASQELIKSKIGNYRQAIDEIDDQLIHLMNARMEYVGKIGDIKVEESISILQPERWKYVLDRAQVLAKEKKLTKAFVTALFNVIHEESINQQLIQFERQNAMTKQ